MSFSPATLSTQLVALSAARYVVAFSGGLDSTALLHALHAMPEAGDTAAIEAVHVNHGLQAGADEWANHCGRFCAALGVAFKVVTVDAAAGTGESPEAAARAARYCGLARYVGTQDVLLTAHHLDDQAETLLLQLLRGSGPAGLAAMPRVTTCGQGRLARPLLDVPRLELEAYCRAHGLRWIEDDSNRDESFDRNYLRHSVLPMLEARWPSVIRTLARDAGLQADALELIGALASEDLRAVSRPSGSLSISSLRSLTPARQRNVIRAWISAAGLPAPGAAHLERILLDALVERIDANPRVNWSGAEVRRYRGELHAMPPSEPFDVSRSYLWEAHKPLRIDALGITLNREQLIEQGLCDAGDGPLTVRFRRGGERCRPVGRGHSHELKKLFQEAGVPPWVRDRVPLVYRGDKLVAVLGYWVCE